MNPQAMKPTRQAIALEYGQREAPVLSARGSGELAERIMEEARRRGVYIAEDPALLGLLGQLDLDQSIPEELYAAVAVVLSWSYWLRGMVPGVEKNGSDAGQYQPSGRANPVGFTAPTDDHSADSADQASV